MGIRHLRRVTLVLPAMTCRTFSARVSAPSGESTLRTPPARHRLSGVAHRHVYPLEVHGPGHRLHYGGGLLLPPTFGVLSSAAARSDPLCGAALVGFAGEYPMKRVSSGLYGRSYSTWGRSLWPEDRSSSSAVFPAVAGASASAAASAAASVAASAAVTAVVSAVAASVVAIFCFFVATAFAVAASVSTVVSREALQVQATNTACPCRSPCRWDAPQPWLALSPPVPPHFA